MTSLADIQRHVGVTPDGLWGPNTANAIADALGIERFDRASFLARYRNTKAPAINRNDMIAAASRLGVSLKHIEMVRQVESAGRSFDEKGRPTILFEPHVFWRQANWKEQATHFAYARWGAKPYPKSSDARWEQMADAAEHNEAAALASASWGLFQIMGFHWQSLGYESPQDFAAKMVESEGNHLDALVRFIETNQLTDKLAACRAGSPNSCRAFARAYNGAGYEKNRYHVRMSDALR